MLQRVRVGLVLLLFASGVLLVSCGDGKKPSSDTVTTGRRHTTSSAPRQPVPGDVVTLAKTYQFAPVLSPPEPATTAIDKTGKNKGVPKTQDPGLTYARAVEVQGTSYPKDQQVLLKIHADRAYPGLDIAQGDNYIWRDKSDPDPTHWQVWIVSDTPPKTAMLKRGTAAYSGGPARDARLVMEQFSVRDTSASGHVLLTDMLAFGICLDDPVLCGGHCGYSE